MQEPLSTQGSTRNAPSFYLTGRQPLRPGAILLATVGAFGALCSVLFALGHTGQGHPGNRSEVSSGTRSASAPEREEKDDPDRIDTIVIGDPANAPVPGRRGDHVSSVHPTILVHLPRYGDTVGLIPNTPAGHLLYRWLAAFNKANDAELGDALPNVARNVAVAAQMELRRQTGGFNLLSAKEALPGVLVFRLRDQTPEGGEVLGTLQVVAGSSPAAIASFSLRAVSPRGRNVQADDAPSPTATP